MAAAMIEARGLPAAPVDAAARCQADIVPHVRAHAASGTDCVILFDPAGHGHADWQLAFVRDLAREAAPLRINAIVAQRAAEVAIEQTMHFLDRAPGVTGQIFTLDANAGEIS